MINSIKYLLLFICFGQVKVIISQNNDVNEIWESGLNENLEQKLKIIDTSMFSKPDYAKYYYLKAVNYRNNGFNDKAYDFYLKAKNIFDQEKDYKLSAKTILQLIYIRSYQRSKIEVERLTEEYITYAENEGDILEKSESYALLANTYLHNEDYKNAIRYYDKASNHALAMCDTLRAADFMVNKAVSINLQNDKIEIALEIYKEALSIYKKYNDKKYVPTILNNQAKIYQKLKKYDQAIEYLIRADSTYNYSSDIESKEIIYENLIELFVYKKKYKTALSYFILLDSLKSLSKKAQQNSKIVEIQEKFDNEKLRADKLEIEAENLEIESEKKQSQNLLIASLILLFFGSIIAFLLLRNTKRKQHIAEQERKIEIQKTEKLLKEQEITTINAMVEGQEKERQRLASDLHDSVGATLAAAKLQFDHLSQHKEKANEMGDLFDKTSVLLQDAYTEIRSMAHTKNSGVMAKDGLLPAITKLAKTVSVKGGLQIEVTDFGLNDRLENALEITVFRIIQELVTNIVKHADATMATISISKFEDGINIIVEDDGKGFAIKNNQLIDGMGLGSIERRVEFLEGTLEIDSTIHKGTTIVIDIPI